MMHGIGIYGQLKKDDKTNKIEGITMSKVKIAILGSTGMLGAITLDWFAKSGEFDVVATYRGEQPGREYSNVEYRELDAEVATEDDITKAITGVQWVVNAIGVTKPYIHDDNADETVRAVRINSLFPYNLGRAAEKSGAKVIQIATDCVYSGEKGKYVEDDLHDALDVYGKSKSLGEAHIDSLVHVRCSIIGPEVKGHLSLLDWFLGQAQGASVNGFTNHQWNGVTTLHFAKIAHGIIKQNVTVARLQHVIPGNMITKANLLKSFAKEFGRADITINEVEAPKVVDRTLATTQADGNMAIWKAAGYDTPPTIEEMVAELARYGFAKQESEA